MSKPVQGGGEEVNFGFNDRPPVADRAEGLCSLEEDHLWRSDYEALGNPAERVEFYRRIFATDYIVPSADLNMAAITDFLGYISYLSEKLEGLVDRPQQEAASAAYSSLAKAVHDSAGTSWARLSMQFVARYETYLLNSNLDINKTRSPETHADPIVGEFYQAMRPHLNMPLAGGRYDSWDAQD